jgi:hypothetical protein
LKIWEIVAGWEVGSFINGSAKYGKNYLNYDKYLPLASSNVLNASIAP